jgi:hypothetical protein
MLPLSVTDFVAAAVGRTAVLTNIRELMRRCAVSGRDVRAVKNAVLLVWRAQLRA